MFLLLEWNWLSFSKDRKIKEKIWDSQIENAHTIILDQTENVMELTDISYYLGNY